MTNTQQPSTHCQLRNLKNGEVHVTCVTWSQFHCVYFEEGMMTSQRLLCRRAFFLLYFPSAFVS